MCLPRDMNFAIYEYTYSTLVLTNAWVFSVTCITAIECLLVLEFSISKANSVLELKYFNEEYFKQIF